MSQVSSRPKRGSRRLSSCLSGSHSSFRVQESLGLVFCSMGHQEQERVSWQKLVPPSATQPSSVSLRVTWWVSGKESQRDWSSSSLSSPERESLPWSLLMRSTHSAERERREKMRAPGESRLSFWSRWMAVETVRKEFLLWEQPILLGNLMKLSGEGLRRESIFTCQMHRLELVCSNWRCKESLTPYLSKTLLI